MKWVFSNFSSGNNLKVYLAEINQNILLPAYIRSNYTLGLFITPVEFVTKIWWWNFFLSCGIGTFWIMSGSYFHNLRMLS